jgi:hypothetical protein
MKKINNNKKSEPMRVYSVRLSKKTREEVKTCFNSLREAIEFALHCYKQTSNRVLSNYKDSESQEQ